MRRHPTLHKFAPYAVAGLIGLTAGIATFVGASELARVPASEQADRVVDQAALGSELEAANDLRALLKEARGTEKEADLLYKLAEVLQQGASMQFRVGHGPEKSTPELKRYRALMQESADALSRLLDKFPKFEDSAHATFMLGRAYEETDRLRDAEKAYQTLIRKHPRAPEVVPSQMALAMIAVHDPKGEKHALALRYLGEVEKHPDSPHYPFALFQSAWSHYSLGRPEAAIRYAEKLAAFYQGRKLSNADAAIRENLLQDSATFYYAGFEKNPKTYNLNSALAYFKKLDQGPALGKMTLQFSNLLRVNDRPEALRSWSALVLASEKGRPEALDVAISTFEYQLNNKDYPALTETAKEMAALASKQDKASPDRVRAERLLFESMTKLQARLQEFHEGPNFEKTGAQLASIYASAVQLVGEKDSRVRTIESNLAEILFSTHQYAHSANHYRWVVEHGSWSEPTTREASRKAIAARYESLKARGKVPTDLKAVAFSMDLRKQDPEIRGLIDWIDEHVSKSGETIDEFQFEANRILYSQEGMHEAVERLRNFAKKNPSSKFAAPSATLVVDTLIASQQWEELESTALAFARIPHWTSAGFPSKMQKIAADAKLKRAEALVASRNGASALSQYDEFVKSYPQDRNVTVALAHGANTALALKDRDRAVGYMAKLAQITTDRKESGKTWLAMAKIEEDRYRFGAAARDYSAALALPKAALSLKDGERDDIRRRILLYSFLSEDVSDLARALKNRSICNRALQAQCDRFAALSTLTTGTPSAKQSRKALALASRSAPGLRAIWAAAALENASSLSSRERQQAVLLLARNWKQADALSRLTLLPRISRSVPAVYAMDRAKIRESGALSRVDERAIARRVKLIAEMEKNATDAAALPWLEIRSQILSEVSQTYADLATNLKTLPLPKRLRTEEVPQYQRMLGALVQPYEAKARRLQILAEALQPRAVGSIQLATLREAEPNATWSSVDDNSADSASILRSKWARALRDQRWHQVAFFMQDAEEKSLLPARVSTLAKAVSLSLAGAPTEGSKLLSGYCRGENGSDRISGRISACKGRI